MSKQIDIFWKNNKLSTTELLKKTGLLVLIISAALIFASWPVAPAFAGDVVSYPVSEFSEGRAKYYTYDAGNGITVRYFILKSRDGVIRAAFDACDVCWRAGKGYTQDGDEMICNNCGLRFASNRINEVRGGCNPAPLKRKVKGDRLIIEVKDILKGRQYFDLAS